MNRNGEVDTSYMDIQKAFDRIDVALLLKKLSARFGFLIALSTLLAVHFYNKQAKSKRYKATSGIP